MIRLKGKILEFAPRVLVIMAITSLCSCGLKLPDFRSGISELKYSSTNPEIIPSIEEQIQHCREDSPWRKCEKIRKTIFNYEHGFEIREKAAGVCYETYDGKTEVIIDAQYMNGSDEDLAELLAHEIGHCFLKLDHDSGCVSRKAIKVKKIMTPSFVGHHKIPVRERIRQMYSQSDIPLRDYLELNYETLKTESILTIFEASGFSFEGNKDISTAGMNFRVPTQDGEVRFTYEAFRESLFDYEGTVNVRATFFKKGSGGRSIVASVTEYARIDSSEIIFDSDLVEIKTPYVELRSERLNLTEQGNEWVNNLRDKISKQEQKY